MEYVDQAEARPELELRSTREYVSPYDLGVACAGIGDMPGALNHLERCCDERVMRIIALRDPEFDVLRDELRYQRLVERLDLTRPGQACNPVRP